MLQVDFPYDGAVLSHLDGNESADGLRITVKGHCDETARLIVNGKEAARNGNSFSAEVTLTQKFNDIRIAVENGDSTILTVLWDKASFPRYNFYIDDHSFVYTDIAQQRPKSIFDHFYLKGLRDIHRKYGSKFTLNSFYRNDHHEFYLKDFPDCYKTEWADNADWLRLSFHAYSEFPDRCYEKPEDAAQMIKDFDLVRSEIHRFAGEQSFVYPVVIHWAVVSQTGVEELVKHGMHVFCGGFRGVSNACLESLKNGSDPLLNFPAELNPTGISDIGYYLTLKDATKVYCTKKWYDKRTGALFFGGAGICCNVYTKDQIKHNFHTAVTLPYPNEVYGLATHEQYTYPYYKNYIPEHLERIELACRLATEQGAKPVFAAEGLLGNHAWD